MPFGRHPDTASGRRDSPISSLGADRNWLSGLIDSVAVSRRIGTTRPNE